MKIITINDDNWQDGRGYRKNRLLSAGELQQPGTLFQIVSLPPGKTIAPHAHRVTTEVYIVRRGVCELTVNDKRVRLHPGDLVLMEPGDVHALANPGPEPFEVLVFKTNAGEGDIVWDDQPAA